MNMRQLKRRKVFSMMISLFGGKPIPQWLTKPAVVEAIWKVARMKDNVVVLETKVQQEAIDLIDKHAKQKKAKLHLLSGEPFLYETA